MKYPQLVSTRAVNAISDWLVSQLEQLGVEAPLIYSRLLLSLLHTSVQINDPIEFNNLETYLANRKGNKRNPPCDTDTLKKLTAVQCLMETVSSEQEITKIENLIDELCEKLNDIENNQNDEKLVEDIRPKSSPKLKTNEIEDPRKRYYRAFPALSKEMEDSVWITKRNIKALTWPNDNNIFASTNNAPPNVVNSLTNNTTAGVKKKSKRRRNQAMSKGKTGNIRKNSYSGNNSSPTWDTDFEGSWEMGRDLIKEFMIKQNSRNRSTSESGAYNIRRSDAKNFEKRMKSSIIKSPKEAEGCCGGDGGGDDNENYDFYSSSENNVKTSDTSSNIKTTKLDFINLKITLNDDLSIDSDAETLQQHEISVSNNAFKFNMTCSNKDTVQDGTLNFARRLYERDISNDSLNQQCPSSEQNDFAQFKAKFNSSVEALWKNNNNSSDNEISSAVGVVPSSSSSLSLSSLKHQNLENFWTNYYNHHYDTEKFDNTVTNVATVANDGIDETDFFSMPSNFVDTKADKFNMKKLSTGVFLQNSIWSDKEGGFYGNSLQNSNKNELKIENSLYETDDIAASGSYSFNISKWSECSFETPFIPSSSTSSVDSSFNKNDLRENMLKNSYLFNYKQPVAPTSNNISGIIKNITIHQQHQNQHQSTTAPLSLPTDILIGGGNTGSTVMDNSISSQKKISLMNHSLNSGFVEYSRIKSICNNNIGQLNTLKSISKIENNFQNKRSSTKQHQSSSITSPSSSLSSSMNNGGGNGNGSNRNCANNDDENLLTSDRTHFRPIKQSYADGYEFDIPNNLDEVKFERSESGFLYFESEKYLEYTRYDSFLSDEDPVMFSSSTATATATSSLSSSILIVGEESGKVINRKHKKNEFALKFRIKQTEKYCQTDNLMNKKMNEPSDTVTNVIKPKHKNVNSTNNCNSDSNKSKINDMMLMVENYNSSDSSSESLLLLDNNDYSNSSNSNEYNSYSGSDYYLKNTETSVNLEQWSMAEIEKKCQNNNNTTHTLWGMCPACNKNSMKSVPANRLLKDELNVEADEIMSDLKYMQDLYIGSGADGGDGDSNDNSDWDTDADIDNDEGGNCGGGGDDDDDDTDCDAEMLKECELYETLVVETLMENNDDDGDYDNDKRMEKNDKLEQQQDHIYYDVTKFISDLLKPENAKSLANALGATTKNIYNNNKPNNEERNYGNDDDDDDDYGNYYCSGEDVNMMNDNNNSIKTENKNVNIEKYVGGLWSNNDENMIWTQQLQQEQEHQQQQQQKNEEHKPINDEILLKFRKNLTSSALSSSTATFLEKFGNWKYSNLAELWKNTSSLSSSSSKCSNNNSKSSIEKHHHHNYQRSNSSDSSNVKNTEKSIITEKYIHNADDNVENNNLKNFLSFNAVTQQKISGLNNNQQPQNMMTTLNKVSHTTTTTAASSVTGSSSSSATGSFSCIQLNDNNQQNHHKNFLTVNKSKIIANRKRRHSASQSFNLTEIMNNNDDNDNDKSNNLNLQYINDFSVGGNDDDDNRMIIGNKIGILMKKKQEYEFDYDDDNDINNKTTKMMINNDNDEHDNCNMMLMNHNNLSSMATIITCKYWTTTTTTTTAAAATTSTNHNDNDGDNDNIYDYDTTAMMTALKGKSSYFSANNKGNNGSQFDGISTALAINPSSILKQVAVVTRPLTR